MIKGNLYGTMGTVFHLKELLLDDGSSPFARWFTTLDPTLSAKVVVALTRIESGNLSNVEWFRGIAEYKINWGPGLRIYFGKDGEEIVILIGGGTKKTQQKDIDRALSFGINTKN
jgi:putative addiction module killer protein